jgi:hypothetical protein
MKPTWHIDHVCALMPTGWVEQLDDSPHLLGVRGRPLRDLGRSRGQMTHEAA